ncbi:hypothetical protein PPL_03511 [Heterostelium album PN500]|uniref:Uncharacterized protein n=1 Tax=Heterostelium pallidum (strain ATCC 26659 / Pp 5 / PN500) TaxID=670386 RepID=D3B521_HETP5|nr:hypothetical protein PPL_03511 [Heterostelium album PN500]EFA83499.1 hypothetical protein PPL_03511 [Heterostelium album PN500]|eukprot:XP_020435616.1 hypothetical protein PPL_03511 [Heterostelium album PN500]
MGSSILLLAIVVSVVSGADVLFKDPSKRIQKCLEYLSSVNNRDENSVLEIISVKDYVTALEYNKLFKKVMSYKIQLKYTEYATLD